MNKLKLKPHATLVLSNSTKGKAIVAYDKLTERTIIAPVWQTLRGLGYELENILDAMTPGSKANKEIQSRVADKGYTQMSWASPWDTQKIIFTQKIG